MQIYLTSIDPDQFAQDHCDAHLIKKIIDAPRVLSAVHRVLDGELVTIRGVQNYSMEDTRKEEIFYRLKSASDVQYPWVKFAMATKANYKYVYDLFCALCVEYEFRRRQKHDCDIKLRNILYTPPANIEDGELTDFPNTVPDALYEEGEVFKSYQNLMNDKYRSWLNKDYPQCPTWRPRFIPSWVDSTIVDDIKRLQFEAAI